MPFIQMTRKGTTKKPNRTVEWKQPQKELARRIIIANGWKSDDLTHDVLKAIRNDKDYENVFGAFAGVDYNKAEKFSKGFKRVMTSMTQEKPVKKVDANAAGIPTNTKVSH